MKVFDRIITRHFFGEYKQNIKGIYNKRNSNIVVCVCVRRVERIGVGGGFLKGGENE